MQLFFNSELHSETKSFTFNKNESNHIIKVLRKKTDDILFITNGKGILFTAKISIADSKKCFVTILKHENKPSTRNYYLHIAVAPTKNLDRLEWFLEKATEIGVDEITPIICENSERKIIKPERLHKIIQSAMKQSLQFIAPTLNEAISFQHFLKQKFDGKLAIAHCEETNKKTMKQLYNPNEKITILIGPEGDFSVEEINMAIDAKFIPVSLGKNRLRTETAAIVAVQNIACINQ